MYEIYKVGHPVHWLDGLDLMRAAGFEGSCVVIPHYDNAEGGTHDTHFCYLGERRLSAMEGMLPEDAWVLGIDEHTVLVADLDAKTVTVSGRGGITIRRRGQMIPDSRHPTGPPGGVATDRRRLADQPAGARPGAWAGQGPCGR